MTSIIRTNAAELFDADGDFASYGTPDCDPEIIRIRFVSQGDDYDLVYLVEWAGGIWAEMFTIPNHWRHLERGFVPTQRWDGAIAARDAKGRGWDAAMAGMGQLETKAA